eukprot:scaffold1504_cov417-Prasinococcus_capsulatus_cf.AAC.48
MMCLAFAKAKGKKIAELETERESAAKDLATVRSDLRKRNELSRQEAGQAQARIQELEASLQDATDREERLKSVLQKEGKETAILVNELEAKEAIIQQNARALRSIEVEANKLRMSVSAAVELFVCGHVLLPRSYYHLSGACMVALQLDHKEKELLDGLEHEDLVKAAMQLADRTIKANKQTIESLGTKLEEATSRIESVERWGKLICEELESVSNVLHEIEQERDTAIEAARSMALQVEEKGDNIIELENDMRQINLRQKGLINDLDERNRELEEMRHVMMDLCQQQNSSIRVLEGQLASSAKRVKTLEKDLAVGLGCGCTSIVAKNDHISRMGKQLHQVERERKGINEVIEGQLHGSLSSARIQYLRRTGSTAHPGTTASANKIADASTVRSSEHADSPEDAKTKGVAKVSAEDGKVNESSSNELGRRLDPSKPVVVPAWVHASRNKGR